MHSTNFRGRLTIENQAVGGADVCKTQRGVVEPAMDYFKDLKA